MILQGSQGKQRESEKMRDVMFKAHKMSLTMS